MSKTSRRRNGAKQPSPTFWHGGSAGLEPGDILLSRTELMGDVTLANVHSDYDPNYVYVTSDRDLAHDEALRNPPVPELDRAIYEVRPLGHVSHDPDYPRGVSFRCRQAHVVAVSEILGADASPTHAQHHYMAWTDGSPVYGPDGYAVPNKIQEALGLTSTDFRELGTYPEFLTLKSHAETRVRERQAAAGVNEIELQAKVAAFHRNQG